MGKPMHIREVIRQTFHDLVELYESSGPPSADILSGLKAQIRQRGIRRGMSRISRRSVAALAYVVVGEGQWDNFRAAMRAHGHEFTYSIEDSETGGVEFHIHSHIDEAESVLWAIEFLDQEAAAIAL